MDIAYACLFFVLGAVLGSFYNVVGLRIPEKQSIVLPPSHCPQCKRRLTALDLVPIFSYILLKGKCRGCQKRISPLYMVMELVTALLFSLAYVQLGLTAELIVALLFISLLVIINISDIAYMLIPNKILLFFLPLLVMARIFSPLEPWWDSIVGAVVGFGLLLGIAVVSKGGMGGGDIKLFLLIGLVLGTIKTLVTLFLASIIGLMIGIVVLKVRGQGRKTPIPFGPSIVIAAVISYFYGDMLIQLYSGLWG
ncbi:MAG: prepilin peptidase [Solibacillus sp.]